MGWVEAAAERFRREVEGLARTDRLTLREAVETRLWPDVQVVWTDGDLPYCVRCEGEVYLFVPARAARDDEEDDGGEGEERDLFHEVAHALLIHGLGRLLERQGMPTARLQLRKEEAWCERFALACAGG